MNNKLKLIIPLTICISTLASCNNEKKYTVKLYDYSASSNYTEYEFASSNYVIEGNTFAYPSKPSRKTFSKFVGWTTDKEHTGFFDFNAPITGDVTLYANYAKKDESVVYVDYDDGVSRWRVHKIGDVVNESDVPKPEVETWQFGGLYLNKTYTYLASFPFTVKEDDVTLYTKWDLKKYKVTYHTNSKLFPQMIAEVEHGKCAENKKAPPNKGYVFNYWCSDEALSIKYDFTQPVYSALDLYAKWEAINYSIDYELNGGTAPETPNPTSYTIETETFTLNNPTKTGYTFDGWYDNESFTGDKVTEIAKGSTGNKTLYAKWMQN